MLGGVAYHTVHTLALQFTGSATPPNVTLGGVAYRTVHTLALQFTRSATPPNVYLTSFYVGVLPGLPPC